MRVARPVSTPCPANRTPVAPTSGWTDSLGVMYLSYPHAPGMVATVPPRGLTADRVTPAMLADLHLPGSPATAKGAVAAAVL